MPVNRMAPATSAAVATFTTLAATALTATALTLATLTPAMAESIATVGSSAGSSASSVGSASLKGSSASIEGSSNSSRTDKTALVQDGAYRVAAVQPAAQPGLLRLQLVPQSPGAQPFALLVPAQAFGTQAPVAGDVVQAQRRDYGLQFTRAPAAEPFFLVLADAWHAELNSRPITP